MKKSAEEYLSPQFLGVTDFPFLGKKLLYVLQDLSSLISSSKPFDQQSLCPFPHNILKSCFGKAHYYMLPMMQVKVPFLRLWSPTENVCVQTEKYFEKVMLIPKLK